MINLVSESEIKDRTLKKIYVSTNEKEYFWIITENGKINKNPTEEDLKYAELKSYNFTNICPRCREENNITDKSILYPNNTAKQINKKGDKTEIWICVKHWSRDHQRHDPNSQMNIQKQMRRISGLKNYTNLEGDKAQELVCILFGWEDLNKRGDYSRETPIDSLCKDGLLHQIKGRRYSSEYRYYPFTDFEKDWYKNYKDTICVCISKDGKKIERIYIFPSGKIKGKTSIQIVKNPTDRWQNPITPWYEEHRIKDENILKTANDIWQKILEEGNK